MKNAKEIMKIVLLIIVILLICLFINILINKKQIELIQLSNNNKEQMMGIL